MRALRIGTRVARPGWWKAADRSLSVPRVNTYSVATAKSFADADASAGQVLDQCFGCPVADMVARTHRSRDCASAAPLKWRGG
jgi:hypothetical protein